MKTEKSEEQKRQLSKWLLELSVNTFNPETEKIKEEVQKIQKSHFYNYNFTASVLVPVITNKNGNFGNLLSNLREIYNVIKTNSKDNNSKLADWLLKLIDTADLEQARYEIYSSNGNKIQDIESQIKQFSKKMPDINKSEESLKKLEEKLSSLQTEYVAVLGIFASLILTFSGSMTFAGNTLQGMNKTSFCQSMFFVFLCGFVVLNLIFLVLYVVAKIIGRNIYARCKTLDCTCAPPCGSFNRVRKRLPYIFWTNVILFVAMVLSGICCLYLEIGRNAAGNYVLPETKAK